MLLTLVCWYFSVSAASVFKHLYRNMCSANIKLAFSEEILIMKVRDRPELYDIREKMYRNNQRREKAWAEIAHIFEDDFVNENFLKMKWKNLRDTFLREKRLSKNTQSGQAQKSKKKWKFFDIMSFLAETIPHEATVSNIDQCDSDFTEAVQHSVIFMEGGGEASNLSSTNFDSLSSASPSPAPKKRKKCSCDTSNVNSLIQDITKLNEDEDSVFCESLALGLKKLPTAIKRRAKINLLSVLMEAENEAELAQ